MGSSTTKPIANTRPNRESVLIENPSIGNSMNVPISDTGTANSGINVGRQPCRNRYTTNMTSASASNKVCLISLMPSVTAKVVSNATT